MKFFCLILLLFLAGCATPQERAIFEFCSAEALRTIPQQLVSQPAVRSFYIGDRVIGSRNICKTINLESKDKDGKITKTKEVVCKNYPILEPMYHQQLVNELVDLNNSYRLQQIESCKVISKNNNMFFDIK
jgi:hypothetical protein